MGPRTIERKWQQLGATERPSPVVGYGAVAEQRTPAPVAADGASGSSRGCGNHSSAGTSAGSRTAFMAGIEQRLDSYNLYVSPVSFQKGGAPTDPSAFRAHERVRAAQPRQPQQPSSAALPWSWCGASPAAGAGAGLRARCHEAVIWAVQATRPYARMVLAGLPCAAPDEHGGEQHELELEMAAWGAGSGSTCNTAYDEPVQVQHSVNPSELAPLI